MKWNAKVLENIKREVRKEIVKQTEAVKTEAIRLVYEVHTPKQGRTYIRKGGRIHIASAPGEPYANDTGNAVNMTTTRYEDDYLTGIVNAGAEYAAALEFGTQKMEPRPVYGRALRSREEEIRKGIGDAVERAIKQS